MSDKIRLLVTDDGTSGHFLKRVRENPAAAPFTITAPEAAGEDALLALAPEADAILCYKARLSASPSSTRRGKREIHPETRAELQEHRLGGGARSAGFPSARNPSCETPPWPSRPSSSCSAASARRFWGKRRSRRASTARWARNPSPQASGTSGPNWPETRRASAELFGESVGIIGLGDIGMDIAKRCAAFDMKIFYHQRTRHAPDVEAEYQAAYLGFDELLAARRLSRARPPAHRGECGDDRQPISSRA